MEAPVQVVVVAAVVAAAVAGVEAHPHHVEQKAPRMGSLAWELQGACITGLPGNSGHKNQRDKP